MLAANYYKHNRATLAETASSIWRDPADVVDKIEALIIKGFAAERIAAAVANDPAAYGALRGSGRIMDKFLASGRERKEALLAIPEAESRIRSMGAAYVTALSNETNKISGERQRMGIAIPGLSSAAEETLRELTQTIKKDANPKAEAGLVGNNILQEFATVSRALDLRFGYDAVRSGEKSVVNVVPPQQRRAFEVMQKRLEILQHIVRMGSAKQIIAERQRRALDRGQSIKH
ncbi:Adenosine monophosphate-protein transferase VbhT [compost metagenome]